MAERLTKRTPKGASLKLDNPRNEAEARKQLMGKYKIAVEKLAHYEDLEEQGRLIELPCAVGDTVYLFSYDTIHPFTVNGFEINEYEAEFKGSYCGEEKNLEHWAIRLPVSRIGKTVFLTPEEAEAALKGADK